MLKAKFTSTKIDTRVPMASEYLPVDRRDLNMKMTAHSVALFFALLVQLKLVTPSRITSGTMNEFAVKLYKLVQRRHSKLWNRLTMNGSNELSTSWPGLSESSTSSSSTTLDGPEKILI